MMTNSEVNLLVNFNHVQKKKPALRMHSETRYRLLVPPEAHLITQIYYVDLIRRKLYRITRRLSKNFTQ